MDDLLAQGDLAAASKREIDRSVVGEAMRPVYGFVVTQASCGTY